MPTWKDLQAGGVCCCDTCVGEGRKGAGLCVCQIVCLFVCSCLWVRPVCLFDCLCICLSVCLSDCLCEFVCCVCVCVFICSYTQASACQCTSIYIRPSSASQPFHLHSFPLFLSISISQRKEGKEAFSERNARGA